MVINPAFTVPITVQRPAEVFGEETFTDVADLQAVVSVGRPARGVGTRYTQDGTLFVPRGSDVKAADQFTYNGELYRVVGRPQANQNHPITGDDFGWIQFTIEAAG